MTEIDLSKLLIGVIGSGFLGLIGTVGFFARRLVTTQDRHGDRLGEHDVRITRVETDVRHLRKSGSK